MSSGETEIEILAGTYEEFLLGYKLTSENTKDGKQYSLKQSFTNHSHSGSLRSVANVGKFLASGSTDEVIRLVNLSTRTEHGFLQQQSGTITCLTNFESQFLFSGSEDGTICIWKSGSWVCEKTLKAHQGGVLGIDVHPSGKLALSIGKDRALKTWNLIKGRTGFITNLKGVADAVRWSPKGTMYAVAIANRVDIYCIQTAKIVYSIPFGKRASSLVFPNESVIMVAGDKETVEVHAIKRGAKVSSFEAHKNRVKDMKFIPELQVLVTASNDGFIKMWSFGQDKSFSKQPSIMAQVDTTCRITCLSVCHIVKPAEAQGTAEEEQVQVQLEDEEQESEEDEDEDENEDEDEDEDEEEEDEAEEVVFTSKGTEKSKEHPRVDSDEPKSKRPKK